ncbi:MAG: flagellar hook-length control protein FliK [Terriglobales bacterium]
MPAAFASGNPTLHAWQATTALQAATPNGRLDVALHSDALGTVQVNAALHNNVLGATLVVDRPDVHHWLAGQLPALERTLTARQLTVTNLQLQQQTAGNSGGGASQTPQQPPARPGFASANSTLSPSAPLPAVAESAAAAGRLNLRV